MREYFRWKEYSWRATDKDWRQAKTIAAGVDVGSVSSQSVVLIDREILCYSNMRTGSDSPDSARKAMDAAVEGTGLKLKDIQSVVGTGYGRVNVLFAKKLITEIACHARGANFLCGPGVRTILDMGGQDCKVIRCDETGKPTQFLMNDKCAAGTGRGMEVMGELLAVPIEDIGPLSWDIDRKVPPVSSTCVVFAKSEAMGLLRSGWSKNEVLAAYCEAMAHRVGNLLERIGVEADFVITGGIAKNSGVVKRLQQKLGIMARTVSPDPQIVGALGAALFASDLWLKSQAGR